MKSVVMAQGCRRKRSRMPYLALVEVTEARVGGEKVLGSLRDIGMKSLYVKTYFSKKTAIQEGRQVRVTITINLGKSSLAISCDGTVLRSEQGGMAILFDEQLKWWPLFTLFPINDQYLFDIVTRV